MDQFNKTQNDQSNFWICCRNIFAHQIDFEKCVSYSDGNGVCVCVHWNYTLSTLEKMLFFQQFNDNDADDDDDDDKWSLCASERACVCVCVCQHWIN